MSNEKTIKVTATPEWLAEQVIHLNNKNILLMRGNVAVATIPVGLVHLPHGEELAAVRGWLVEQIEGAYKAGVASVAQAKADGAAALVETYGPDALAKAREEGRADAFRKVVEWCQTSVPDTFDFDASIVEEVAKDAIGRLQHDAYNGDSRAREEGRRQGWEEAASCFDATAKHHTDSRDGKQREAHSLRAQAARLDEEARVQQETAKMARAVAAELRAAAPKESA